MAGGTGGQIDNVHAFTFNVCAFKFSVFFKSQMRKKHFVLLIHEQSVRASQSQEFECRVSGAPVVADRLGE